MSSGIITEHFPAKKATQKEPQKIVVKESKLGNKKAEGSQDKDGDKAKHLEDLKQFDLCWEYGPCIGVTRLERWNRAEKHGLNPPEHIRDLIEAHPHQEDYTQCLWSGYNI